MFAFKLFINISVFILITASISHAQFLDNFDNKKIEGWFFFTGDGNAQMDFVPKDGFATICVDGTKDKYNIYWTLIKRNVASYLDLNKLKDTSFQLRTEARIRVHNAPRRVNMMINTNRTKNYHIDLMEFDIPDTTDWHLISMTTKKFDARPGDSVYVQLCVTDYGLDKYYVDLDYYRADIVNVNLAGPDKGELVPYHPPVPDVNTFSNHLNVSQDCLINSDFPDVNFNDWHIKEQNNDARILTINADQWIILRWDFGKYKGLKTNGPGLLELTTQSVPIGGKYIKAFGQDFGEEFGKIRVIEILGGDPKWDQDKVTYNSLLGGKDYSDVFNSQMIFDTEVKEEQAGKNYLTISKPVLQRLIDGKTKGLLIRPLGALNASFYASENWDKDKCPKLHFSILK